MKDTATHHLATWGIIVLVALNIGLLSVIWYNQWYRRPIPPPRDRRPAPDAFMVRELGADENQAQAFRALWDRQLQRTDSLKAAIHQLSLRMVDEIFSPTPDSLHLAALVDSIGAGNTQLELRLFEHFRALKALCTPEQEVRLRQLLIEVLRRSQMPPLPAGPGSMPEPGRPGDDRPAPPPGGFQPPPGDKPPGQ